MLSRMAELLRVCCILIMVLHVLNAKTCDGNGFRGGCSSVFTLTGEPTGLVKLIGSDSVTEVCEGDRLAVVHDCVNRIPLYVSILLDHDSINATNPGRCTSCQFQPSAFLDPSEQASVDEYKGADDRVPCYERQSDGKLYRDQFWLDNVDGDDERCPLSESATGTSRGHLIADSYVRLGNKAITYRFTNGIPQFQDFNSISWRVAEQAMYRWLQTHCGSAITDPDLQNSAKALLVVGAVPSTSVSRVFHMSYVKPRWIGRWGFGDGVFTSRIDYFGNSPPRPNEYRVNVPAAMWTAACCVAADSNGDVVYLRHTAFGRHAKPNGTEPVIESDWRTLMKDMLPTLDTENIELFPDQLLCGCQQYYYPLTGSSRTQPVTSPGDSYYCKDDKNQEENSGVGLSGWSASWVYLCAFLIIGYMYL